MVLASKPSFSLFCSIFNILPRGYLVSLGSTYNDARLKRIDNKTMFAKTATALGLSLAEWRHASRAVTFQETKAIERKHYAHELGTILSNLIPLNPATLFKRMRIHCVKVYRSFRMLEVNRTPAALSIALRFALPEIFVISFYSIISRLRRGSI